MRKISQVLDVFPFDDGETIEMEGAAPLSMTVISIGDAGVFLDQDEAEPRLIGAGRGSFLVNVPTMGSPYRLRFVSSLGMPMAATISRQQETLYRSDEAESFLVIKPRVTESEDMRQMRLALRLQQQEFERRMTEQRRELLAAMPVTPQEVKNRAASQPVLPPSVAERRDSDSAVSEAEETPGPADQDEPGELSGDTGPLPSGAAEPA